MKVNELITELQEAVKNGYGDATVYVRSEGFTLYGHEAEDEVSFDSVPCTGVEESGHGTCIPPYVVIGREDPDTLMKRLCETPHWSMPEPQQVTGAECKGWYLKYRVEKLHGPTDPNADYFVLRMDKDIHAMAAALYYATGCENTNPELASDIRERVAAHRQAWAPGAGAERS